MRVSGPVVRELWLAIKFAAVCGVGFVADLGGMRVALAGHLVLPLARILALLVALQVTFLLTRWLVFNSHAPGTLVRQWWRYMVANSFGGLCNIAMFVALIHLPWPGRSHPWTALVLASSIAYFINYAGTRLFVYGRASTPPRPEAEIDRGWRRES